MNLYVFVNCHYCPSCEYSSQAKYVVWSVHIHVFAIICVDQYCWIQFFEPFDCYKAQLVRLTAKVQIRSTRYWLNWLLWDAWQEPVWVLQIDKRKTIRVWTLGFGLHWSISGCTQLLYLRSPLPASHFRFEWPHFRSNRKCKPEVLRSLPDIAIVH